MFRAPQVDPVPDYSWLRDLATLRRCLELSSKAEITAKILNLIWTDLASNAVVGTRGLYGVRVQPSTAGNFDDAFTRPSSNTPAVTFMRKRIRYRWEYAVPALIVLSLAAAILFASAVFGFLGRVGPKKIRRFLNKTSQGRILTTYLLGGKSETEVQAVTEPHTLPRRSTKKWAPIFGRIPVTVGDGERHSLSIDMGSWISHALPLPRGVSWRRSSAVS
ncbi:hypothetical protein VTN31DRAFT_836 [Thermomyces dupontii]|uniref:uncharacterized protein n=1 Tax=Talaromyces thermophilus TaxID=28565 RepID=UPI003744844B